MKFYKIFSALGFLALYNSCKNDLKLNAPYKEIPTIYAVLNPQEATQMIRVNKVFLGEGDANVMAKVADSVNYKAGELTVTLNGRDWNGSTHTIVFTETVIAADPGAFSTTQRVYVTNAPLYGSSSSVVGGNYTLTVKNNHTGNEFKAIATTLDSVAPAGYIPWIPYNHYFGDPDNVNHLGDKSINIDYDTEPPNKGPFSIKILPTDGVKYQLTIRMHYYDSLLSSSREYHYVDYPFTNQNKKDANVMNGTQGPFLTNSFFRYDLLNKVAQDLGTGSTPIANIVGRKMYRIDYICYKVSQDYADYLDYNSPSFSIAQTKPLYTNFIDKKALGIFTFRSRYHVARDMSSNFKDMFAYSSTTCKYKFLNTAGTWPLCQ
jgi:hypothetical protein